MRIALLSTLDRDPRPGQVRPAYVQFSGARVIERQLDLALLLNCEAVVCITDGIGPEVIELQHRAEKAGAKFVAMRDQGKLSGLVNTADEILLIAPGILPDNHTVERLLTKSTVIAFPADIAVPAGFERIDPEFAWGGVLLAPGDLVERLAALPTDIDIPSAFMRIALQAGARLTPAERKLVEEGEWTINADREQLLARERKWIDAQREPIAFTAPGLAVAERVGARLARDIIGRKSENVPTMAAGAFALFAIIAGIIEVPALGLGFITAAALCARIGGMIERIACVGRGGVSQSPILRLLNFVIDPIFIVLLAFASSDRSDLMKIFVPLVLFGLLKLGEWHGSENWRRTYADRILLGFFLVPAAFFGLTEDVTALIALLVLASRFLGPFRNT